MPRFAPIRRVVLLLGCLLPVIACCQEADFQYLTGLQIHQAGGWTEGPEWWSHERFNYLSDPLEPLRITSIRWQYDSWMEPDLNTNTDNTYAFPGLVDYDPGVASIRSPGQAHQGENTYRVSRISDGGCYLEDKYTENPWGQYHQKQIWYFYNNDMRLIRKIRRISWPLEFWKSEYSLDAQGRRLLESVSSSPDSLNWTPRHSLQYVYGGEAVPAGYQFEKYSAYVPWVYSCGGTELPPFPYLNDNQVITAVVRRDHANVAWCEPDTFALDLVFSAEGATAAYRYGNFTWSNEGLPKSSELPGAEPYLGVIFTFANSATSAAQDPLLLSPPRARVSPNPSSGKARITFSHPKGGAARVRIYNLRGQLLEEKCLVDLPPGTASLEWEAADPLGGRLPNGVYLIQIETADRVESIRAALLR